MCLKSRQSVRKIKLNNYIQNTFHGCCGTKKKPDLDNLIKSLFDSISKSEIVWSDDNIVCDLRAKKIYSPNPRIEIEIEEL